MIIRSRFVVTMDGPPIEDGAVVFSDGRIQDVGPAGDVKARHTGEIRDLGDFALLPGLINAHCHLDYTCLRGRLPPPRHAFADWIRAINAAKADLTPADYVASIKQGFAEAQRFGTVAMANLTAFPELIPRAQPLLRTTWFAELIDVRDQEGAVALVERSLKSLEPVEHAGLCPHAPFTASRELYQLCARAALDRGLCLTTHLAESRDEMAMFRDASGPLYDFMRGIGRDMDDCGDRTPLAHFLSMADASQPWLITHLNELSEGDFQLLAQMQTRFDVVHCPRSHGYFGHAAFPYARLRSLGFNVALGTDSLASNDDLNLFAEMRRFRETFPEVASEEILALTTRNAALALGWADVLGRLAQGYSSDMVAVPFAGSAEDLLDAVVTFTGEPLADPAGQESEN
jgi:cytosine/adenosine deaminase-related metal-dependent hydrolase